MQNDAGAGAAVVGEEDEQATSRIQIVVRVRPVLPHEASQPVAVTCPSDGGSVQVVLPEREFSKPAIAASSKPDAKAYEFDACLPGSTTQAQLFDVCGMADLVEAAVDGYNVTVFAFGQTGSSKTYSIIGPSMAGMQGFDDGCADAVPASHDGSCSPALSTSAASPAPTTASRKEDTACSAPSPVITGPSEQPGDPMQLVQEDPLHAPADSMSHDPSNGLQQTPSDMPPQQQHPQQLEPLQQQQQQEHQVQLPQLSEHEGLLARCVHQLFATIRERQRSVQCSVAISCTEVYNETVTDLLARNKTQQLQVRQDPRTEAFYVEGLTHVPAQTPSRALRVLFEALSWRHTRAHKLNSYSSRSHCLITLTVSSSENLTSSGPVAGQQQQQEASQGSGSSSSSSTRRFGKLVLADLAGSERLSSTGNTGAREAVKETGAINRSLFTLGQVLAALSVRGGCGAQSHVPYRDSRLTQLLWDGLRGGGRVLMLACLCPLKAAAEESLNTLHFASMALRIKSTPVIMMDPQDQQLNEMRSLIKVLQEDCRSLANALTQMTAGADLPSVLSTLPPTLVQDALRYGSSSAPTLDQQLRQRSPAKGQRSLKGGLRASGSLGKPKSIYITKPLTADPRMRHSMPALPYHTSSTNSSGRSRVKGQQQQRKSGRQSLQQQQQPQWGHDSPYGAASKGLTPPGYMSSGRNSPSLSWGAASSSPISSWPAYATPPRSTHSMPLAAGARGRSGHLTGTAASGAAAQLRGAGSVSLGPSSTANLFPSSLRQQLYHAGASGLYGVLSGPAQGSGLPKPSWISTTRVDAAAAKTSQLCDGELIRSQLGCPAAGSTYQGGDAGLGGIWGLTAAASAAASSSSSRKPLQAGAGTETPKLESFPELAALEQQFQLLSQQQQSPTDLLQQQQQPTQSNNQQVAGLKPVDAQLFGPSGVLLPSGLPASIQNPHSLVPVRLGVAETDCVGTSPDASPAAVALAAADSQVRPIAVALPTDLTAAAAAKADIEAAAAAAAGGAEGTDNQSEPDPQALTWAQRNVWFGADADMTRLAYEVHDMLVGQQGVDASSQLYYTAIESHVAAALPEKWAHWQKAMAASRGMGVGAKARVQPVASPTLHGLSYKLQLKSPTPKFSSSPGNSPPGRSHIQQQHNRAAGAMMPTLSQALQHPALAGTYSPYPTHQQQQQVLDRALPQQVLQHYQQEHPQLLMQQPQQPQQHHASLVHNQQQQQMCSSVVGLPELRHSESPQPPLGHPDDNSSLHQQHQHQGFQCGTSAAGAAGGLGLLAAGNSLGLSSMDLGRSGDRPRYPQQQQQSVSDFAGCVSSVGGISAAASKVLQASAPSFYDGAGPLTSGTKPAWRSSNQQGRGVQAGADLAQVLRSGLNPGNKSLAELQAEYKAARVLVLDRLRQQKEAAEAQRKQILLQLGRAIGNGAWRA